MRAATAVAVLAWTFATFAQAPKSEDWQQLVKQHKCKQARAICTPWINSPQTAKQVEAHKCMANVELCESPDVVELHGNDAGGGAIAQGFMPENVDHAIQHLNIALKLAPQDVTIHKGRLHILEMAGRFDAMAIALDESCKIYKTNDGAGEWLDYTSELFEDGQYRASLKLLEVLKKHYPNSHDVLGNMAAMHMGLGEFDKAFLYLNEALRLAPGDPIDTWNLARAYDFAGKMELADEWYPKALAVDPDPARKKGNACLYGKFVEEKLKQFKRACELQRDNCPAEQRSACGK